MESLRPEDTFQDYLAQPPAQAGQMHQAAQQHVQKGLEIISMNRY